MAAAAPLKILHVLRAPVGGLFRHVLDLASGQAERGHQVGIIAAQGGGAATEAKFAAIAGALRLGIDRIAIGRELGLGDIVAVRHAARRIRELTPDVVHGHGAKGGAYARLAASAKALRVYTPHGGSLHYGSRTPQGVVYGAAERLLMRRTDLFLFESAFARRAFISKMGEPRPIARVVANGVRDGEFDPVDDDPSARDVVTIGELRHIKGIDVLIDALALLSQSGQQVSATIVGEGPDRDALKAQADARGLGDRVSFAGYQPARTAFGLGRLLIVGSRAESLPYIVLEAAAAGRAMLATNVGGIPEVFGDDKLLLPPGDPAAMAQAIGVALGDPARLATEAGRLRERVRSHFSQNSMVDGVLTAYADALSLKFQRTH